MKITKFFIKIRFEVNVILIILTNCRDNISKTELKVDVLFEVLIISINVDEICVLLLLFL